MNFLHIYTNLLMISLLSYEMRERPWWMFYGTIALCAVLAIITVIITERRSNAPCS